MRSISLLTVLLLAAPAAAQEFVPLDVIIDGELSASDRAGPDGTRYDVHRFAAQAGRTYAITAVLGDFEAHLRAGPADGDDCHPCHSGSVDSGRYRSVLLHAERSGTYLLRVSGADPGALGTYAFSVEQMEEEEEDVLVIPGTDTVYMTAAADTLPEIWTRTAPGEEDHVAYGQQVAGVLDEDDGRDDNAAGQRARFDEWYYDGVPGETITVTARSADFDAMLGMGFYREDGAWASLGADDDGDGGTDSRLSATLPEVARIHIRVAAKHEGGAGAYTLRVDSDRADLQPDSVVLVDDFLNPWGPTRGRLREGDRVLDGRYADVLSFQGLGGMPVTITVRSDDFDPAVLVALAPGGQVLRVVDDGRGGREARVTLRLPYSGTFYVRVTPVRAGASGAYEVALESP
jgi:hypothetical protein